MVLLATVVPGIGDMGLSCRHFQRSAPWKSYISVVIAVLLALAALTRNPNWAMASGS